MKNLILSQIERFSKMSNMHDVLTAMSAHDISYQVTVAEPNVIRYWFASENIEGKLYF